MKRLITLTIAFVTVIIIAFGITSFKQAEPAKEYRILMVQQSGILKGSMVLVDGTQIIKKIELAKVKGNLFNQNQSRLWLN